MYIYAPGTFYHAVTPIAQPSPIGAVAAAAPETFIPPSAAQRGLASVLAAFEVPTVVILTLPDAPPSVTAADVPQWAKGSRAIALGWYDIEENPVQFSQQPPHPPGPPPVTSTALSSVKFTYGVRVGF